MVNPLKKIISNPVLQARALHVGVAAVGLARDFWKDGKRPRREDNHTTMSAARRAEKIISSFPLASKSVAPAEKKKTGAERWSGDRLQVLEKIWGEGNIFPGGHGYVDSLLTPLGLNEEMSVLDLNAGLGGLARQVATDFGSYATGLELSAACASRGMIMSIAAGKSKQASVAVYDPSTYEPSRTYDCVIARELFYRVIGKKRFFTSIVSSLKPGVPGHVLFTDYILEVEDRQNPAVIEWFASEKDVSPSSLKDMKSDWKAAGISLRVAEDQTALYRHEILKGLAHFAAYLTRHPPDAETKKIIEREVELWARKVKAFDEGLKYYRFYGVK